MPSNSQSSKFGAGNKRRMKRREPIRRPVRAVGESSSRTTATAGPTSSIASRLPLRKYVTSDLKRIAIISVVMFATLIVLSIVL